MRHSDNGSLEIRNIQKRFVSQTALTNVDLVIRKGEFFSLLGPSGCGKSTLLRILAGLENADSGEILWEGRRIDGLPARERPFNMVFQKYALFPHLTVFDNVAFGLRLKAMSAAAVRERVDEVLGLVNLRGFERRLPETLSGGQAQRVALARALANRPECVLLDEPLTALDQKLREHMQTELRLLQRRLGLTFVFVTHDQEEAMLLSDRIAIMNAGRVEQVSTPRDLYESPNSIFSARFIGRRNELPARVTRTEGEWVDVRVCETLALRGRNIRGEALERGAQLFIRPERLRILESGMNVQDGANSLEGEVVQVLFRGTSAEVILALPDGGFLRALIDEARSVVVGERVRVEFLPHETHVFAGVSE